MSTDLSTQCLLHHVPTQSFIPSIIVDLVFSHKILLLFSLFRALSIKLPKFVVFNDPYVPSHYILMIFVYKTRACTVTW